MSVNLAHTVPMATHRVHLLHRTTIPPTQQLLLPAHPPHQLEVLLDKQMKMHVDVSQKINCYCRGGPFLRMGFPICTRCKLGWVKKYWSCTLNFLPTFVQIEGWVSPNLLLDKQVKTHVDVSQKINYCYLRGGPFLRTGFPICTRCKLGWVKNIGHAH